MDLLTFVNNSALAEQASDATYISYTKAATSHAAKAFPFSRRFDTDSSSISRMIKAFFKPYKFQSKSPDTCMNKRTLRSSLKSTQQKSVTRNFHGITAYIPQIYFPKRKMQFQLHLSLALLKYCLTCSKPTN
jgi:hypothetical protein